MRERIEFINESLKDIINYKSNIEQSPFQHVYKILDEIGRKLEWPAIPVSGLQAISFVEIENKFSYLLGLKAKAAETASKSISITSLNKQISFYGLALFFNKLIEFNAVACKYFSNMFVLIRKYKPNGSGNVSSGAVNFDGEFNKPIDFAMYSLIYCLKLWHKFNSHKEFLTIGNRLSSK